MELFCHARILDLFLVKINIVHWVKFGLTFSQRLIHIRLNYHPKLLGEFRASFGRYKLLKQILNCEQGLRISKHFEDKQVLVALRKTHFVDQVDKFREFDFVVDFTFADVIEHEICHMDILFASVDILDSLIERFVICPQEMLLFNVLIRAKKSEEFFVDIEVYELQTPFKITFDLFLRFVGLRLSLSKLTISDLYILNFTKNLVFKFAPDHWFRNAILQSNGQVW